MFLNAEQTHLPLTLLSVLNLPVKVVVKTAILSVTCFFSSFKISTLKSGFILNQKFKKNGVQVVFLNYTMVSMLMSLYGQYVLECWVKGVVEMTVLLLRMFSVRGLLKRMRVLKLLFIVFYLLGLNKFQ